MITAQEAYDLARPNFDEYVDFINQKITEAAKNGRTVVIIRDMPYADWLYGSDKKPKEVEDVLALLKANGFQYKLYYNECQFVDTGLQIMWDQGKQQEFAKARGFAGLYGMD